jgi:YfiH family protein
MTSASDNLAAENRDNTQVHFTPDGMLAQATPFLNLPWLKHGSTTRSFSPPHASRTHELQHLRKYLELPTTTPIVHAEQKHTAHVAVFKPQDLAQLSDDYRHVYRQTDAIVCTYPGIMLAILTADCAPVFIVDTHTRNIALAHAGWKGTLGRIVEGTVASLLKQGSRAADLLAWVGPMISPCCYEVSPELVEQFREEFSDAAAVGCPVSEGRMLDLVSLNVYQLERAGVSRQNIFRSGVCTQHEKHNFYSYRGDAGTTGRIISCLYTKPDA